ncbi:MAG: hypothetical protein KC585_00720 [Candidatus Magasanikbacteria bacterium]|nr:hypothetical protein [Candidatus Magasanikbacteria bacterium]MCA9389109.1 hypothetical protein [Candidatus Magasanikbacteria bacterium]
MEFNPFAKNNLPSVSMFAKEKKKTIRATAEVVDDLERKYLIEEFLGVDMNFKTRQFFKELVGRVGESDVKIILGNIFTFFSPKGELFCLDLSNISLAKDKAFIDQLKVDFPDIEVVL